jgi:hypothetical protein
MHTDLGIVAGVAFDHVLSEPIERAAMNEHPAAMAVDSDAVVVRPEFSRPKRLFGSRSVSRQ